MDGGRRAEKEIHSQKAGAVMRPAPLRNRQPCREWRVVGISFFKKANNQVQQSSQNSTENEMLLRNLEKNIRLDLYEVNAPVEKSHKNAGICALIVVRILPIGRPSITGHADWH